MTAKALGESLLRLRAAKADRGVDWLLHSSWCSDQDVFVARVLLPGRPAQAAAVKVGALAEVLAWAAGEAER